jgi:UPF0271 protein
VTSRLDLNADLGEHDGPPPAPARALLRLVTSVNIACGGHAGDAESMRLVVADAAALGVQIGAHPSFPDRDGFGRRVLPMTLDGIREAVADQVRALGVIALRQGAAMRHVKPHGALYNLAVRDAAVAAAVVAGVIRSGAPLALYAPSGSALAAAGAAGVLRVVYEGFLDRSYEDDGTLTPREVPGAVLHDPDAACARATTWAGWGLVRTRTGRLLALPLETLCVHGDTPEALAIATRVREALAGAGVRLVSSLQP